MAKGKSKALDRRKVVARILKDRGEALLVTGLGAPTYDAAAAGDRPENFYLWGGMGGAALVGLGLALAQPSRRVLVITGDGEMLMGVGALATIAVQKPVNLAICVLDNERYGETGMQETHTAMGVDLVAMARGAGFRQCTTVRSDSELEDVLALLHRTAGPVFVDIKIAPEESPRVLPPRDGPTIKHRFKAALLGRQASG